MRMVEGGGRGWPAIDAVCLAKVCHIRDSVMVSPLRWWIRELLSKGGRSWGGGGLFWAIGAGGFINADGGTPRLWPV